jgi:hypothetical protein
VKIFSLVNNHRLVYKRNTTFGHALNAAFKLLSAQALFSSSFSIKSARIVLSISGLERTLYAKGVTEAFSK